MKDLSNYRESYEKSELSESNLPDQPILLFAKWFEETVVLAPNVEANAMTISTVSPDGFPRSRVVLLKSFKEEGFVFFTNYTSNKGRDIEANPNVCLSFFWAEMQRQVIIRGIAEKISAAESTKYFNSRPVGSQLGAVASEQSQIIESRDFLEAKLQQLESELQGKVIPRPEHWGGFLVKPISIEFWQGRANRLHDRIIYTQFNNRWERNRLSP